MAANETVQPAIKAVRADLYTVDTPLRRTLRRFRRHRLAVLGLGIVLVLIVLAVVGSEAAANKQNLAGANLPPSAREALGGAIPHPARLGRPEEYAALVLHVVGNEMLNGEVIRVDGALRMAPR